jgi:signal peptidase II
MKSLSRLATVAYLVALAVIVVDQAVKYLLVVVVGLTTQVSVPLLGPIDMRLVWNEGISFGLFRTDLPWTRWALAGFSGAVAIALAVWARRIERPLTALAVGLVMGGAVGNLIDRVRYGAVADFLDASRLHFPWIFNVADSAISIGIALLLAESLFTPRAAKG